MEKERHGAPADRPAPDRSRRAALHHHDDAGTRKAEGRSEMGRLPAESESVARRSGAARCRARHEGRGAGARGDGGGFVREQREDDGAEGLSDPEHERCRGRVSQVRRLSGDHQSARRGGADDDRSGQPAREGDGRAESDREVPRGRWYQHCAERARHGVIYRESGARQRVHGRDSGRFACLRAAAAGRERTGGAHARSCVGRN